jgi:hypothetical protein
MIRRSRAFTAGSVFVPIVVAALVWGLDASSSNRTPDGKGLVPPGPSGVALSLPIGTRSSFGVSIVKAEGEGTATLLSVTPENLSGPLEYLGSVVAGPDREYAGLPSTAGFPPAEPSLGTIRVSEGAVLTFEQPEARDRGWEVLVGYRVTGPGVGTHDALRVKYEMDGKRYSLRLPSELTVCSGQRGDACEPHQVSSD